MPNVIKMIEDKVIKIIGMVDYKSYARIKGIGLFLFSQAK
jgi:hypothetical protein